MIRKFFSPPVFENDEDNFRAKFINGFAWFAIFLLAFAMIPYLGKPAVDLTLPILAGLIAVSVATLYLLHRRNIEASGLLIIVLGWLGFAIQAYAADGVKDVIIVGYIALSLLASIVVSWRAGGTVMVTSIAVIWVLEFLETHGYITPTIQDPFGYSFALSLIFVSIATLIYFSTTS